MWGKGQLHSLLNSKTKRWGLQSWWNSNSIPSTAEKSSRLTRVNTFLANIHTQKIIISCRRKVRNSRRILLWKMLPGLWQHWPPRWQRNQNQSSITRSSGAKNAMLPFLRLWKSPPTCPPHMFLAEPLAANQNWTGLSTVARFIPPTTVKRNCTVGSNL